MNKPVRCRGHWHRSSPTRRVSAATTGEVDQVLDRIYIVALNRGVSCAQLLLEEFGKYAAGRQAYFTNIYNQVSHWGQATQLWASCPEASHSCCIGCVLLSSSTELPVLAHILLCFM